MRAFIIDRYSKKNSMRLGEMPDPEVRDDDVLIEVHATGLNLLDAKIKAGEFKLVLPYRFPLVLGHDVAGVVTQTGSRVRQFKVGDEVYSRPADYRIGTFAELISVNERDVAFKPKTLTMEEAASIPLVGDRFRQPGSRRVRRFDAQYGGRDGTGRGRVHSRLGLGASGPAWLLPWRLHFAGDRARRAATSSENDPRWHRSRWGHGHRQSDVDNHSRHD